MSKIIKKKVANKLGIQLCPSYGEDSVKEEHHIIKMWDKGVIIDIVCLIVCLIFITEYQTCTL